MAIDAAVVFRIVIGRLAAAIAREDMAAAVRWHRIARWFARITGIREVTYHHRRPDGRTGIMIWRP